uniref:Uncharacterized protein n=1 Tax=Podoviridae sp. cty0j11 TaxID=2826592 RepID=A0A8S5MCL9_9CAUD|nr:MAG TPA: hypothetical protein [Podoviridae sp. cty0j11]
MEGLNPPFFWCDTRTEVLLLDRTNCTWHLDRTTLTTIK